MAATPQTSSSDLHGRIRRLEDEASVTRLLLSYADRFDGGDSLGVAELFTADAVVDYGPEFPDLEGRHAIRDGVAKGMDEIFLATSHHISNAVVDVDGDRADCSAYVYAWHRYRDGSPDGYLWGRYLMECVRRGDGWRIARLRLEAAGTEDFHRAEMHPIGRKAQSGRVRDR
jgi:ketosteroid isomerase-like protein